MFLTTFLFAYFRYLLQQKLCALVLNISFRGGQKSANCINSNATLNAKILFINDNFICIVILHPFASIA